MLITGYKQRRKRRAEYFERQNIFLESAQGYTCASGHYASWHENYLGVKIVTQKKNLWNKFKLTSFKTLDSECKHATNGFGLFGTRLLGESARSGHWCGLIILTPKDRFHLSILLHQTERLVSKCMEHWMLAPGETK